MILQIQQQTPEWLQARLGRVTASRVKDVMAKLKSGLPAAPRKNYMTELACERLTGRAKDHFVSAAMAWGTENEKYARAAYEIISGNEVEKVGMAIHPRIEQFGASPDGAVGTDGLVEFKCALTETHVDWMDEGNAEVPEEHRDQCYSQMACWERDWVDFASFDPRIEDYPDLQMFMKRLPRDEKRIMEIEVEVERFLEELQAKMVRLIQRCGNPTQVREQMQNPKFKEQLRKSVEDVDPDLIITDRDLPAWARK